MNISGQFLANMDRLIRNTGSDVTYIREAPKVYNPAIGGFVTGVGDTDTEVSVKGAWAYFESGEFDGTQIMHGDRRFITTSTFLTIEPKQYDLIADEFGTVVKVVDIRRVSMKSSKIGYILHVRGSGQPGTGTPGGTGSAGT